MAEEGGVDDLTRYVFNNYPHLMMVRDTLPTSPSWASRRRREVQLPGNVGDVAPHLGVLRPAGQGACWQRGPMRSW